MIIGLTMKDLTLKKEKTYFKIILVFAIIVWILIAVSIVGIAYGLFFAFLMWLANGLFVAHLRSECVAVNDNQLPKLYETFKQVCGQLEIAKKPDLFILQSGGMLNAFAMRHAGRDFVVILSDILESYGEDSDEIRFIIGHELGHLKSRHIFKHVLLAPASWLPLVGTAYSRACEASCDRYGAYVTREIEGAVRAMMMLAGGKQAGKTMSGENFSHQHSEYRGFFISWYELISGYPTLSQRVANLVSMKTGSEYPRCPRHWLSYIFAFFTFGGQAGGASNFFMTIFVVAMLASIALPNLLKAKLAANDAIAKGELLMISQAARSFAADHDGKFPGSVNELTSGEKKYLIVDHCDKTYKGFKYVCTFTPVSFEITATPVKIGETGTEVLTVSDKDQVKPFLSKEPRLQVDTDFEKLRDLVDQYHKDNGQWPPDAKGSLTEPWMVTHPTQEEPVDPYDFQPYGYRKYSDHYELQSCGPDEECNTEDDIVFRSPPVNTAQQTERLTRDSILDHGKLISFLNELNQRKIPYTLSHDNQEAVMIHLTVPRQRWEVEFLQEGSFKIEKFISNGREYGESELKVLYRDFSNN